MNETYVIDREFLFKTNIHEITSISIEHNYDIVGSNVEGEFDVSGDYRLHEISINKEDFSFKIPFTHLIKDNVNLDTIDVEITDFSYEFKNQDELKVHVEYTVTGELELIEFNDEEELSDFLENNKAEVIDLSHETDNANEERIDNTLNTTEVKDNLDIKEDYPNEIEMPKEINQNQLNVINNIHTEDAFIKYHVHTVCLNDTLESICSKYHININTLKKYNTFENLELNMKLLIPENEES